jgi:hypothetical protein
MPIIAVNVPPGTFSEVMALVAAQRYASPEQFLEIAAFNQLALERGTRVGELVTRTSPSSSPRSMKVSKTIPVQPATAPIADVDYNAVAERFSDNSLQRSRLPDTAKPQQSSDRIWGQVNRYLPMKVATRWIAVEASRTSIWPSVSSVVKSLSTDASAVGDRIRRSDVETGRVREDMLSIGLPQHSDSADRFITQIVGRLTRSDKFHPGALFQYGLVTLRDSAIALTDAGVNFAWLRNPVLDDEHASESLSEQERAFLVAHVFGAVPPEADDFRAVLGAIREGHGSPDALIASSRNFLPASWTDLARRTHVYGLLARMGQIGLVGKNWEGRRVTYVSTPASATVAK